ncbi:MAG TPA: hypothetical protein VGG82_00090 [Casimicrobiaceae bacterium]
MTLAGRRRLLQRIAALPLVASSTPPLLALSGCATPRFEAAFRRVRPSDPSWPPPASWQELDRTVGGRLMKVLPPFSACQTSPFYPGCDALFRALKNPYYIGDEVGLTQTLGWVDAWTSAPSVYAVAARDTNDVVAASVCDGPQAGRCIY